MSFIAVTRPTPKEIRVDRLLDGSPVDSLIFRMLKGSEIKRFFKQQELLTRSELRPQILVPGAERVEELRDDKEYVLETYYDFINEGLDRYRVEEKSMGEIMKTLREREKVFTFEGRSITALDDLLWGVG